MGFRYFLILLKRKIFKKRYLVILVLLAGFYFYGQLFRIPDGKLHVRFLDVGQGDATLITTPKGSNVLIDGGPNDKVSGLLNQFVPPSDRIIDLMFLTHPHADHMAGLISVLGSYQVKNIAFNPINYESTTYTRFLRAVDEEKKRGARVLNPKTGDKVTVGDLVIKIVWVPANPDPADLNDDSIISVLSYGDFDVFMPGDAGEKEANAMILGMATPSAVEVLKAAHHGSKNGLNTVVLTALHPLLTVISVGKGNSYGHPNLQLVERLRNLGSSIQRTDLGGTIDVVSDGKNWKIAGRTFLGMFR